MVRSVEGMISPVCEVCALRIGDRIRRLTSTESKRELKRISDSQLYEFKQSGKF